MSGTSKGFSIFSGKLGLFRPKPRKVSKSAARQGGARALARKASRKGQAGVNPWQAAQIQCDQDCACEAVKKLAGTRFFVRDVPQLPMPDCDVAECNCTYRRYKDRREWGSDRRAYYSLQTKLYGKDNGGERRNMATGRRADDEAMGSDGADISLEDIKIKLR